MFYELYICGHLSIIAVFCFENNFCFYFILLNIDYNYNLDNKILHLNMNYKDRCRTCLGSEKEMRHVHSVLSIAGDDVRLSDVLQNFYNYTVIINKNEYFYR